MNSLKNNILNSPAILAGISHEVRTHMNAIVAFSYLIKENNYELQEREDYSNQIFNSCEQLIGLFDSFLDSAILEAGESKVNSNIHKLDTILDELSEEFRAAIIKDSQKNIELVTEMQFNDNTEVVLDRGRVTRIIRCLFQNSLRTTKNGYIKIGYSFDIDKVNFYILDSGHGFFKNREFLNTQNMNESLSQDRDTITAINMTLARHLIQMMGGAINIECNGLTGTGIFFSIPSEILTGSTIKTNNNCVNSMIAI